jgi:hypothetical protein
LLIPGARTGSFTSDPPLVCDPQSPFRLDPIQVSHNTEDTMKLVRGSAFATTEALLVLLCMSASANAASAPFGCRASVARVGLVGSTLLEPLIANAPGTPCANDNKLLNSVDVPTSGNPILSVGPVAANTVTSSAPGAAALTQVNAVRIPSAAGPIVVVGPVYAEASYGCSNGKVVSTASSTLDLLYIGGNPVTITPNENETIQLGGGSYISINESVKTGNSLTERILDVHLAGLADVVVGEAQVTQNVSDPCAGTKGGGGGPFNICPPGTTYDPGLHACVLTLPGGGVVIINPPFGGETGGTVVPLGEARRLYHSQCLYGPGPGYVIAGTNHADRINGTRRAERILGLAGNDLINGGGGNDCVDGGFGNDRLTDKDGNARVYGGPGSDRIFVRNGNDHLYGGPGRNRISAGRGNDWIYGGPGISTVYMDNGPKQVFLGARGGTAFAPGARDAIHCAGSRDVAYVNIYAAGYAQRHGCRAVHPLTPARL